MATRRIDGDGRDRTQETLRADAEGAVVRVVGLEMAGSGLEAPRRWREFGLKLVSVSALSSVYRATHGPVRSNP